MAGGNKAADILRLIRGSPVETGIQIVTAKTANPLTFVFQGSTLALDDDLFEIPEGMKPIRKGDKFFVLPILGEEGQRYGLITKLT